MACCSEMFEENSDEYLITYGKKIGKNSRR